MPMLDLFTNAFQGLTLGGSANIGIVGVITTAIIAVGITRNTHKIRVLLLPLGVAVHAAGLNVGALGLTIFGVIHIITAFSLRDLGNVIAATTERVTDAWQSGKGFVTGKQLEQRRIDAADRAGEARLQTLKAALPHMKEFDMESAKYLQWLESKGLQKTTSGGVKFVRPRNK